MTSSRPGSFQADFAKDSIVYKDILFHDKSQSIYFGPPSNETDNAWTKIADEHVIRMQKEEVTGLGEYPIRLPESSGYASSMAVGHEIHCLVYSVSAYIDLGCDLPSCTDTMAGLATTICLF